MNSEGMKVAVVGCGYWGKNLVRNLARLEALAMVCDVTEEGRAKARELAPDVPIVADFESVMRSDVPGVVLATPASTHYMLARWALEGSKDVFVEKPLALDYTDGAELVKLAERMGRILMVGHVLEYHPGVVELLRLVKAGELGRIQYVYSNRLSFGKVRREENILWSFAPHDIAVVLRLMGELPYQVAAAGGAYLQPNIADVTVTNLLFNNGVRAHIHVSWLHPFKEQRFVVIGDRRMASFDDVEKRLVLYDQHVDIAHPGSGLLAVRRDGEEVPYPDAEPLLLECEAFLEAMSSRRPALTDGASGVRVLQILQAAQRSLITNGEPVVLPESGVDFMVGAAAS